MAITPQDVRDQRFRERRKGYDVDEVDAFLERIIAELEALTAERDELQRRVTQVSDEPSELLARTLMTAQRTADDTVAAAQDEAQRRLADARAEAAAILEESRQRAAAEQSALDSEAARVSRAAESLVRFRSEYRTRVRAVIAEQLALLDRAGELPDVPAAIADLAAYGDGADAADQVPPVAEQQVPVAPEPPAPEDAQTYDRDQPGVGEGEPPSALGDLELDDDFFSEQGSGTGGLRGSLMSLGEGPASRSFSCQAGRRAEGHHYALVPTSPRRSA